MLASNQGIVGEAIVGDGSPTEDDDKAILAGDGGRLLLGASHHTYTGAGRTWQGEKICVCVWHSRHVLIWLAVGRRERWSMQPACWCTGLAGRQLCMTWTAHRWHSHPSTTGSCRCQRAFVELSWSSNCCGTCVLSFTVIRCFSGPLVHTRFVCLSAGLLNYTLNPSCLVCFWWRRYEIWGSPLTHIWQTFSSNEPLLWPCPHLNRWATRWNFKKIVSWTSRTPVCTLALGISATLSIGCLRAPSGAVSPIFSF